MTNKLIEAMARALEYNPQRSGWVSYENDAQAALKAISDIGYAVVPREPTEAMIAKAWDEISKEKRLLGIAKLGPGPAAREVYRAMINATTEEI